MPIRKPTKKNPDIIFLAKGATRTWSEFPPQYQHDIYIKADLIKEFLDGLMVDFEVMKKKYSVEYHNKIIPLIKKAREMEED